MNKRTNEPEDVGASSVLQALILQEYGPSGEGLVVHQCQMWDQPPDSQA